MITVDTNGNPLSAQWYESIAQPNTVMVVEAQVYNSAGSILGTLPITSGTVTISRSGTTRRSATLKVIDPTGSMIPLDANSMLNPFGNYIKLACGYRYASGQQQLVSVGTFAIRDVDISDTGTDFTINVTAPDYSYLIGLRGFKAPYLMASGTYITSAIETVLNTTVGVGQVPLRYSIVPSTFTLPQSAFRPGSSPWQAATILAQTAGYELFLDVSGTVIARPIPNPLNQAVAVAYIEGGSTVTNSPAPSGGSPITLERIITSNGVYNDFFIASYVGSSTTIAPIIGEAADNNPASLTYIDGPFGDVVNYTSSTLVGDQAQANAAAQNALNVSLGNVETMSVTVRPNPALDIDDVVFIQRARMRMQANYILDEIDLDLKYDGVMTLKGRRLP